MIIQLQIYHCDGEIYRGGRFAPNNEIMGVLPQRVSVMPLLCEIYKVVLCLRYHIYFATKISVFQEFDVSLAMDQFQGVSSIGH